MPRQTLALKHKLTSLQLQQLTQSFAEASLCPLLLTTHPYRITSYHLRSPDTHPCHRRRHSRSHACWRRQKFPPISCLELTFVATSDALALWSCSSSEPRQAAPQPLFAPRSLVHQQTQKASLASKLIRNFRSFCIPAPNETHSTAAYNGVHQTPRPRDLRSYN